MADGDPSGASAGLGRRAPDSLSRNAAVALRENVLARQCKAGREGRQSRRHRGIRASPAEPGSIAVSVDDSEGLPADNIRYAVLDVTRSQAVLFVTSGSNGGYFAARALGAIGATTNGFGCVSLIGRILVPSPAARTIADLGADLGIAVMPRSPRALRPRARAARRAAGGDRANPRSAPKPVRVAGPRRSAAISAGCGGDSRACRRAATAG